MSKRAWWVRIRSDLSKACDCLPHDLLDPKLGAYGLAKESFQLISDNLSYRKQSIKTGCAERNWANVIRGVSQGSILGPLLFNIFINDIFLVVQKSDICNFADDNALYSHCSNLHLIRRNLECINSLKANPGTFQFMIVGYGNFLFSCDIILKKDYIVMFISLTLVIIIQDYIGLY